MDNFLLAIKEMIADNSSNSSIESAMNRFPIFKQVLYDHALNSRVMMFILENCLYVDKNQINEGKLHKYAQLMQKIIINDEMFLLNFLATIITFLNKFDFSLNEIDKVINVLIFAKVLPLHVSNHWTHAKNPSGQSSTVNDRLAAIERCISFKYTLYSFDFEQNEYLDF